VIGLFHRTAPVDADLIPISPTLPVLEDGAYVWPVARVIHGQVLPTGSRFYSQGDCRSCDRCGHGNSTIAPFCKECRQVLAR